MGIWIYTAAERRTIDEAYSAVSYILDHIDHSAPYTLRAALRHERWERSSVTVAKALLVAGFADGRKRDPRASELAYLSDGIAAAAILGAKSRRWKARGERGYLAEILRRFPKLAAAAAAAHDSYMARGLESSRLERAAV